ncbi:S-locus-specific glycoprotein S13-like [Cajanus cajan]|uniref:S-locus-specific glycoprotein S13-like n=1 Tax=Cajanus cajan TaxID=3821 RepID=UPI0010FB02D9|nr:S-locus-specific glycoprotein S13-like [Cajanus cajan]
MRIVVYILFVPSLMVFIAADTSSISHTQSLTYGDTIVSYPQGTFELGFFNLGKPNKTYLGIRYKNIPLRNVVWVANVGKPINDSSAILKLNSSGNLVLTHNNIVVWSTDSPKAAQNPVAELLDSGNLVIRDENSTKSNQEEYLWQSFDYPSDTMLPGMKIGWDLKRNRNRNLISWKSNDDPTPGDLSWGIAVHPYPEIITMKGTKKYQRVGPWNGLRFSGMPEMSPNPIYHYEFFSNKEEVYYTWTLQQSSLITRAVLNQTTLQRIHYIWSDIDASWVIYSALPADECDYYGVCGANSYCRTSASPMCECLQGFNPKSPEKWNSKDWSQGCVLKQPQSCKGNYTDEFDKYEGMKVPETTHTWLDENIDLAECKSKCLKNCSCMAYTNSNISGEGSGCVLWFGELFDIVMLPTGGQDLYIRIPASELGKDYYNHEEKHGRNKMVMIIIATTIAVAGAILLFSIFVIYRVRRNIAGKLFTHVLSVLKINHAILLYIYISLEIEI